MEIREALDAVVKENEEQALAGVDMSTATAIADDPFAMDHISALIDASIRAHGHICTRALVVILAVGIEAGKKLQAAERSVTIH